MRSDSFRRSGTTTEQSDLQQDLVAQATEHTQDILGHHRIFTWVPTEWGEENVQLSDSEVADKHGVPRRVLVKCISNEIEHEEAFLTLPWAFLLLMTFTVCLITHDRANDLRHIEDAVDTDLHENAVFAYSGNMGHKDIHDAHNTADVFTWLRVGLAPLFFKSKKAWSEFNPGFDVPLTEHEKKSYLQYNRLLGGIRLSQSRAVSELCPNRELTDIYDMVCSPPAPKLTLDLSVQPEYVDIISQKEEFDPRLTRWFLLEETFQNVEERLRQLEAANWIDNSTIHVAVHFLSYNANLNCLTYSGAHFFFSRTGRLWKKIVHSATFLDLYAEQWVIIFDVIFVLLVFRLFVSEILDVYSHLKHRHEVGLVRALSTYLSWWNLVDWVSIAYTFTMVFMWLDIVTRMNALEEEVVNVSREEVSGPRDFSGLIGFGEQLNTLMVHFKEEYDYQQFFRIWASLFPVCLMLRLFKAFAAQPRLALVTQTISLSIVDVSHFLGVFFTIFSTFVVMAIALFGREMEHFSTFGRAFNTCFLVLMGDFDYDAIFAEARGLGSLWFWLFQVILVLLMLNMLLAIIMDTYSEVKSKSSDTETVAEQLYALYRRWRWIHKREGLDLITIEWKLAELYGKLRKHDLKDLSLGYHFEPADIITVKGFAEIIDGLEMAQAKRLVTLAVCRWRQEHSEPMSLTEATMTIGLIHRDLENHSRTVAQYHQQIVHGLLLDNTENGLEQSKEGNGIRSAEFTADTTNRRLEMMEGRLEKVEGKLETMETKLDTVVDTLRVLSAQLDRTVQRNAVDL